MFLLEKGSFSIDRSSLPSKLASLEVIRNPGLLHASSLIWPHRLQTCSAVQGSDPQTRIGGASDKAWPALAGSFWCPGHSSAMADPTENGVASEDQNNAASSPSRPPTQKELQQADENKKEGNQAFKGWRLDDLPGSACASALLSVRQPSLLPELAMPFMLQTSTIQQPLQPTAGP